MQSVAAGGAAVDCAVARREIHRHVAEWLEERAPTDAGAGLVARHYERAAALDLALGAYLRAGRHAASLGQNAAACACYRKACRIDMWLAGEAEPDDSTQELYVGWESPEDARLRSWPDRVRLRYELGQVERRMGELERALRSLAASRGCIVRCERRSDEVLDPREVARWDARIDFQLSLAKEVQGDIEEARRLVEHAIAAAERVGLYDERAEMLAHLAGIHLRQRDLETSRERSLEGLRVCRTAVRHGERWREAVAWLLRTLGGALYHQGRMVSAERCYLQAARTLDEARSPAAVARVLNNVATARFARGQIEAARNAFRRTLELSDRAGDLWMTMTALGNLGEVEHHLGHSELARDYLEESVRLGERIGARADLAEFYRNLAVVRAALGERPAALSAAARALELATAGSGDVYLAATAATVAELCAVAAEGDERQQAAELARALAGALERSSGDAALVARCRALVAPLLDS